jgi:hypothetical protein
VPTHIIGRAQAVPFASGETKDASFAFLEIMKLEWIDEECEYEIPFLNSDRRTRSVWLRIPTFVKVKESRFHKPPASHLIERVLTY